jgi:hypothetical protein
LPTGEDVDESVDLFFGIIVILFDVGIEVVLAGCCRCSFCDVGYDARLNIFWDSDSCITVSFDTEQLDGRSGTFLVGAGGYSLV